MAAEYQQEQFQRQAIHLAFASDQAYALGLLVSVGSAARHCPPSRPLVVHLLDGGINEPTVRQLAHILERCHPQARLQRHLLQGSPIFQLRDHGPGRELVYARLLIPELIGAPRVLYLDVDLLVLDDLAPLVDQPLGPHLAAACVDPIVQRLAADPPYPGAVVQNPQMPYFNSGVLLIDSAAWARERITEQALALLQRHATTCRFRDQTVLNHFLEHRWLQLDQRWNTISRELEWVPGRGLMPDPPPAVLHYCDTAKPWLTTLHPQLAHRLWQRQASRIGGLPLLLQLPSLTQRQLLKQRLQEASCRPGRRRRRAMTQLLSRS